MRMTTPAGTILSSPARKRPSFIALPGKPLSGTFLRHPTYFLYAEQHGEIQGVLPLAHVSSLLFGNALVALPFAVYGGVAANTPEAAAALEAEAQSLARKLAVDHLEFRNIKPRHADWPTQSLYVTFRKEILPDVEANMLAIPRKQRAMVRKGINNGLQSVIDNNADQFFALFADNVHRHGTPALSRRYFTTLLQTFGQDCEILTVTSPEGRPLSSVLSFYFRDEVLPYYAGDDESARQFAANDFKYWELMRRSCERGVKIFDYGRSEVGTRPLFLQEELGFRATAAALRILPVQARQHPAEQPGQRQVQAVHRSLAPHAAGPGQSDRSAHRAQPGLSMANILFLVHRLPYPPNKGDKVRSFHLLEASGGQTSGSSSAPSSMTRTTSNT